MDCAQTPWLSDEEYLIQFSRKIGRTRVPLCGTLDLTHRCNLRCVHCYLGPHESQTDRARAEMTTAQVISVMDEFTAAGCLSLLISGGEPLLRRDFPEVYRHAKTNGLLVSVFSNGTLITEPILDLFADLPPQAVEITLYGATAPTYESITGVAGSYGRCMAGIRQLIERGIRVKLKTVLMTLNSHDFEAMENLAQELGVRFRFDPGIFPRLNGDRSPLALRVAPQEAVAKEFANPDTVRQWRDYYEARKDMAVSDKLYNCGAGLTNFHIDPYGKLHPCVMSQAYEYDLLNGSFVDGWNGVIAGIRQRKASASYPCNRCPKRTLCSLCPSFSRWENGAEEIRSEYLCAIGHLRYDAICNSLEKG